jgi:small subunit ribosomal protein S18
MVSTTQNYELYFILNPELTAEQVDDQVENIEKILKTELKAENLQVDKQGLKKLAYSIQKQQTGFYVLITFDLALGNGPKIAAIEKKLNMEKQLLRYIIVNQTEYLTQKEKEQRSNAEITHHNELNKKARKPRDRNCIVRHMGVRAIDYKDTDFLNQFTSPYAKIFHRDKTGTSAKYQRKITRAVKRARHMALMPFTPQD